MTGTAVYLTLTEEERELIQQVLEERHRTMLIEIAHTDHHHFKVVLKKKADLLEDILNRFTVRAQNQAQSAFHRTEGRRVS